jgi:hypothetical protein
MLLCPTGVKVKVAAFGLVDVFSKALTKAGASTLVECY